ncbi:hypothetical protein IU433_14120 [Nocardia puris]|uniref:hypothetical protein n=1 Tax=Nocardia puris TaxID=208602 RepID=UPI0018932807|nr:hypothetical protein [Nocardia puris]MBF6460173.1 hypothetical protein [Nocardia puris]
MNIATALLADVNRPRPCIVGRWFARLDPASRAEADQWLASGGKKSSLLRVARSRGYSGSGAMWYAHTNAACACHNGSAAAAVPIPPR